MAGFDVGTVAAIEVDMNAKSDTPVVNECTKLDTFKVSCDLPMSAVVRHFNTGTCASENRKAVK